MSKKGDAALIVMAAGMGSRFGGLKQLEPMDQKGNVILDFSVYDAMEAGFNHVVFVIKHEIEDDFKRLVGDRIAQKVRVSYVHQEIDQLPEGFSCPPGRVKPWGTGHAVLCCRSVVDTPFAAVNADDYYGKNAFRQIYQQLVKDDRDYCMVGFRLGNTVTENGTVSRGVCLSENGILKSIQEYPKISSDFHFQKEDGTDGILSPDTVVSMNMWGFTPDFFSHLEQAFREFLAGHGEEAKSEFYLPSAVDRLIRSGEKQVRVLVAEDKWYGVTYREDKETVYNAFEEMIAKGLYPGL